ncbi:transcription antitermination protein NusB [Mycoplasma sp. NEAQ87857]|uniref:transcription antitermination factor NusB n=1 Tax=Mycoplasma sp. NEAQ87857 TaxID=2683967 RepID=UPI0013175687|nr:transcription antitermination factor NusB [Mycoplasma sp. NEAQ87857]QGZ97879.1 transcription antitermination protein NusB [Mycoplasma sp. NEAQ87857]
MNHKTRRQIRIEIIQILYKFELLETPIDLKTIMDEFPYINDEQLLTIKKIAKNYDFLKKTISKFMNRDWSWDRVSPLIRGILLNSANELFFLPPRIVINEALEITKTYFPKANLSEEELKKDREFDHIQYRFVNGILENYYKLLVHLEYYSAKDDAVSEKESK